MAACLDLGAPERVECGTPREDNGEDQVALAFDRLGEEWLYEPYRFTIRRNPVDGHTTVGFCPDFFLPRRGIFVEVTQAPVALRWGKYRGVIPPHVRRKRFQIASVNKLYQAQVELMIYSSSENLRVVTRELASLLRRAKLRAA